MLKYDGMTPKEFVLGAAQDYTLCMLVDCYGHQRDRAEYGWNLPRDPSRPGNAPEALAAEPQITTIEAANVGHHRGP